MEIRREIGYGAMVLSAEELKFADRYKWNATIQGEPNSKATLNLELRKSAPASFGRTGYIYSGTLEVDGKFYRADMNLFTVGPITYGFIKAKPF